MKDCFSFLIGFFADPIVEVHTPSQRLRDCDVEMESPYNRQKDALMSEDEEFVGIRPPLKHILEIDNKSLSVVASPMRGFFIL